MDIKNRDEIEDMTSIQIAGRNGFGHNIDFMSQAYLRNRSTEIIIEDDNSSPLEDCPLPIYLKVLNLIMITKN